MFAAAPRLGYRMRYTSGMTLHIWEVEYRGHQQRELSGERWRHGLGVVGRSVYKTRYPKFRRARRIMMPMTGFLSLESVESENYGLADHKMLLTSTVDGGYQQYNECICSLQCRLECSGEERMGIAPRSKASSAPHDAWSLYCYYIEEYTRIACC